MPDVAMEGAPPPAGAHSRSLRLDVFRGLAALFMVTNHAGYALLGAAADGAGGAALAVFVTSAAPALFFFASGVGAGMSGAPESVASVARKVLLLLLADAFMNWRGGGWLGFDFFGFAAAATLVLAAVRWSRAPRAVAAGLLAAVVLLRFGLGPLLRGAAGASPVFAFVAGVGIVPGVSYPLCPWLAFPLAGFLVGKRASAAREALVALLAGAVVCGAAFAMARHGAVVFRWGSVSLAWFLFAIGVVALAWAAAGGLGWPGERLMLRGPASLLVVPLHFAALPVLAAWLPLPLSGLPWAAAAAVLCLVVVAVAKALAAWAGARLSPAALESDAVAIATLVAVALCARLWALPQSRNAVECAAQVAIGLLLARRLRRPAAVHRARVPGTIAGTR